MCICSGHETLPPSPPTAEGQLPGTQMWSCEIYSLLHKKSIGCSQLRNAHSKDKKVGLFLAGTPLMADFGSKPFQDFADLFFRPHGNLECFHHFLFLSLSFKVKLSSQYDGSSSLPGPILMFLFMAFFLKPFAQLIPSWFLLLGGPDLAFHSDHFEEQHHLCFLWYLCGCNKKSGPTFLCVTTDSF